MALALGGLPFPPIGLCPPLLPGLGYPHGLGLPWAWWRRQLRVAGGRQVLIPQGPRRAGTGCLGLALPLCRLQALPPPRHSFTTVLSVPHNVPGGRTLGTTLHGAQARAVAHLPWETAASLVRRETEALPSGCLVHGPTRGSQTPPPPRHLCLRHAAWLWLGVPGPGQLQLLPPGLPGQRLFCQAPSLPCDKQTPSKPLLFPRLTLFSVVPAFSCFSISKRTRAWVCGLGLRPQLPCLECPMPDIPGRSMYRASRAGMGIPGLSSQYKVLH